MESTSNRTASQQKTLPPGLFPGVIPEAGTQLSLEHWLLIFQVDDVDVEAFKLQLWKDRIVRTKFGGTIFIDATHFRRVILHGREGLGSNCSEGSSGTPDSTAATKPATSRPRKSSRQR